ncbi:MAG: hypothetical protein HY000_27855, partial [Planctomycetes bacterium]|nr:hypothetical protein [Planctomycetota bacterium]
MVLFVAAGLLFLRPTNGDEPRVNVFLWFDTEDYLLPADDDATLRLCEFLTAQNIRATFKLVGEKARVLEQRGRKDVIDALKKHEIGYHSDFHSVQPTPALYMSQQGWDDGVAEFDRRERRGVQDITRIFGRKPSCYGQPGSSWGPQQFGAMRQWGMGVFLDAGRHVSLDGGPFWYCGILNLYALKATLRTGLGGPEELEKAKTQFDKAYEALLAEGGGPVSIYYHPCEFVHAKFWDGVNFAAGANPPRSQWKVPPQKSPQESRVAYETFEAYVRFIKAHPNVAFVTASEGLTLYRDRAINRRFSTREIQQIATRMAPPSDNQISFQRVADQALAPSELLSLLNQFAAAALGGKVPDAVAIAETPMGPTQQAPEHGQVWTDRSQFERTVQDVAEY